MMQEINDFLKARGDELTAYRSYNYDLMLPAGSAWPFVVYRQIDVEFKSKQGDIFKSCFTIRADADKCSILNEMVFKQTVVHVEWDFNKRYNSYNKGFNAPEFDNIKKGKWQSFRKENATEELKAQWRSAEKMRQDLNDFLKTHIKINKP